MRLMFTTLLNPASCIAGRISEIKINNNTLLNNYWRGWMNATPCGHAIKKLCERAYEVYGETEYSCAGQHLHQPPPLLNVKAGAALFGIYVIPVAIEIWVLLTTPSFHRGVEIPRNSPAITHHFALS